MLALDLQGNLVVIENKRDDSGTGVEWQAIKYASYCSTLKKQDVIRFSDLKNNFELIGEIMKDGIKIYG